MPQNTADTIGKSQEPSAKKHIALIANTGWNIVRYRGELMSALIERGWKVSAIAAFSEEQARQLRDIGAHPYPLHINAAGVNPFHDIAYFFRVLRILRRLQPDLVHAFTMKPVIYGAWAAKLAGIQCVVASITGGGMLLRGGGKAWIGRIVWPMISAALSGRTQTIFQNPDDLALFVDQRALRHSQATCIASSGVNTAALKPDPHLAATERTCFLMASRMLWSKGVGDFVAAARLVKRDFPEVSFVLYGGSREDYDSKNPDFIERAWLADLNREGIVTWRGRTDAGKVEAAMRSAAAVVLPSYYPEGVPRCLIEAASAGTPIITTDTPGCRDAVIDDVSGFLVPPKSPTQLAEAMATLLRDPTRIAAMGLKGRDIAVTTFDARLIVDRTISVYQPMLAY
ncbi:MAG: glycosyltransferase family 4 protein [Geminicoccaceae bacterium]